MYIENEYTSASEDNFDSDFHDYGDSASKDSEFEKIRRHKTAIDLAISAKLPAKKLQRYVLY